MEFMYSTFGSSVSGAKPSRAQDLEFSTGFPCRQSSNGLAKSCTACEIEGYRELRALYARCVAADAF